MAEKKKKDTTFEVGPISELRMRAIMEETWRGAGKKALWDTLGGIAWEVRKASRTHMGAMQVYKGKLYFMLGFYGEIYSYDGTDVKLEYTVSGVSLPDVFCTMFAHAVFNDALYFGGVLAAPFPPGNRSIIVRFDGTTWSQQFFVSPVEGVGGEFWDFAEYGGYLYTGGIYVWRTSDGLTWQAFHKIGNTWVPEFIVSLEVFGGVLYVTTAHEAIWATPGISHIYTFNGAVWGTVTVGTGERGFSNLTVFEEKMYVFAISGNVYVTSDGATYILTFTFPGVNFGFRAYPQGNYIYVIVGGETHLVGEGYYLGYTALWVTDGSRWLSIAECTQAINSLGFFNSRILMGVDTHTTDLITTKLMYLDHLEFSRLVKTAAIKDILFMNFGSRPVISTDKDVNFTGAIIQNAKEDENVAGLFCNKVSIVSVVVQGKEPLHFRLLFWRRGTFEDTDLDVDRFIGFVDLDLATNGFQIAGANQYYMNVTDVNLEYEDWDETQELHISLMNLSVAAKSAGVPGEVKIDIIYVSRG